jgi:hypothetical protein
LGGRSVKLNDQLAPSTISARVASVRVKSRHGVAEALDCGAQA